MNPGLLYGLIKKVNLLTERIVKMEDLFKNIDITKLQQMMEEMANAPREEYGKRQPGEKGMYETQRKLNVEERLDVDRERIGQPSLGTQVSTDL